MKSLTFVTGNPSKAKQLSWHLGVDVIHESFDLVEIQSLNLNEIIEYKAREAFKHVGKPVLVDDTSLEINAIGRLPGPLAKWFLQAIDNDGICKLLNGYKDRSALASVLFGYYDGDRLKTFEGKMVGSIADVPRGTRGFGWDPIFIPTGYSKTWGEMTIEEQTLTSMRRAALKKLEKELKS
jgi:non-canonical purine NTP pyrophosphatase (RdgB/HAM1 family)